MFCSDTVLVKKDDGWIHYDDDKVQEGFDFDKNEDYISVRMITFRFILVMSVK